MERSTTTLDIGVNGVKTVGLIFLNRLWVVQKNSCHWENGGGYIGVERRAEGEPFEYYIGMLTPVNTLVPDGFVSIDFKDLSLGTCWIYGKENEVHDTSACKQKLAENGMKIWQDEKGAVWSFENCLCPRYTTPDDSGNVILDYCYFVTK